MFCLKSPLFYKKNEQAVKPRRQIFLTDEDEKIFVELRP